MKKTIWLLLDDRKGSVNQTMGIVTAIGERMNIVEKNIVYTEHGWFPNWIRGRSLLGVDKEKSSDLNPPYPDIVLSSSRRTVPVARYIRKKSNNSVKIVQLMYPSGGIGIKDMELVVIPSHDRSKKQQKPNAMVILGAPTQITNKLLQAEKDRWEPVFANLPKPWTTVIIGGRIKGKPYPTENISKLADLLKKFHEKFGGSFLLTTSRRTGEDAEKLLLGQLKDIPMYTYLWGEQKENPIMGFYACSDFVIATADSVSMCSEACETGKPVFLFKGNDWLLPKHLNFAETLVKDGYARLLEEENFEPFTPKAILNPAYEIAEKILEIK